MPTVGTFLRQLREAKSLSVEEISRATRMPQSSIERIELDRFDELPGEVASNEAQPPRNHHRSSAVKRLVLGLGSGHD